MTDRNDEEAAGAERRALDRLPLVGPGEVVRWAVDETVESLLAMVCASFGIAVDDAEDGAR